MNSSIEPAQAILWLLGFMIEGAIIGGLFTPIVIATRRGVISYMSAFAFGVTLCMLAPIPMRIIESEVMYQQISRQGWWPIVWTISYTGVFITVLSWTADKVWDRIKKHDQ